MFAFFYDAIPDESGIRFVILRFWKIHHLKYPDIESVSELGKWSAHSLTAFNFKNRLLARSFLITTKSGWFIRKVLVTPADPTAFLSLAAAGGVTQIRQSE